MTPRHPQASTNNALKLERAGANVELVVDIDHHQQETDYTCGAASLKMVLDALWGTSLPESQLAKELASNEEIGTRQSTLENHVRNAGLNPIVSHTTTSIQDIRHAMQTGHAVIVCYWLVEENTDHYAVVDRINKDSIVLADPYMGPDFAMDLPHFDAHWFGDQRVAGRKDRWMMAIPTDA